MTLSLEQAKAVYEGLKIGYRPVESRMQFGKKKSTPIDDTDICQHLLGYDIPENEQEYLEMYSSVDKDVRLILDPYLDKVMCIVNSKVKSVQKTFLIMSSNWCGKKRQFKHIHTLLQNDPQRCITMSFPIPLYIDKTADEYHKFYWSYRETLFPKITYTSHNRMENISVEYTSIDVPKNNLLSITFDSARSPHWIDNTSHLYLWFVCDAVVFKNEEDYSSLKLNLYNNVL